MRKCIRRLAERCDLVVVDHPRFFSLPRYGRWVDGVLYFVSLLRFWDQIELSRRALTFDWADSVEQSLDELNLALKGS